MQKTAKTIFITLICCAGICFTTNVWCENLTSQQQQQLLLKVNGGFQEKSNEMLARQLVSTIKILSPINTYNAIMLAEKGAINIYVVNLLIKDLSPMSTQLFDIAVQHKKANIITYASYITVAGKIGHFVDAQRAFEEACKLELADVVTYDAFIAAMGADEEYFEKAYYAYREAIDEKGFVEAHNYS